MIYDTYVIQGNCRGCGYPTEWHINKDYPYCPLCMQMLIEDVRKTFSSEEHKNGNNKD